MPTKGGRPHYRGSYQVESRRVRDAAYADPTTRCITCMRTLAEIRVEYPHATWDAGHVVDGTPGSPLAAECSHCNRSHGAHLGNAKRRSGYDW